MENLYARTIRVPAGPVYVPGEQYAFYMNFDVPISDPNFDSFRLDIYKNDTVIMYEGVAALSKDIVNGATYNMYCIFEMPALPAGTYQFVIVDTSVENEDETGPLEKCRSNWFICETDEKYYNRAPTVLYRNESNFYGFNYENIPDFFNVLRLPLIQIDYQYELQKTQYRNATDQRLRNIKSYRYPYRKIEAYYFSQKMHDAMSVLLEHDGIYIDGLKYVTKDAYNVATGDLVDEYCKGTVNAYIDDPNAVYTFPINTTHIINPTPDVMAQKTTIKINDGAQKVIQWQVDTIEGTAITYFQRHGNSFDINESDLVDGKYVPNGTPSYDFTKDADGNIITFTLTPQVEKSVFTII